MIYRRAIAAFVAAALAMGGSSAATAQGATRVDLELALLVDVSGSVDAGEFILQRDGYVNAFNNPSLFNDVISRLPNRSIAVSYVYWAWSFEQAQLGGAGSWFLINSVATSQAFASAIAAFDRPFAGLTAPGSAIDFVRPQFASNAYRGSRWVIDVSGDGVENDGVSTAGARDAALARGVDAINGLAILGDLGVEEFYRSSVRGGANSFVEVASGFDTFEVAVQRKIGREVNTIVPEPGTYLLLGTGLLMLGVVGRMRTRGG